MIVTAGPTYEDLDPVRFVGNRSSGKMGYALAAELAARGAAVDADHGTDRADAAPGGIESRGCAAPRDMHDAVMAALPHADALVMAAAVANYTPPPLPSRRSPTTTAR